MSNVKLYRDNEGETYLGHSLDEVLSYMRDDLGVDDINPPEQWQECEDWQTDHTPVVDQNGHDPEMLMCDLIRAHIENGGPVPIQFTTTYI